MSVELDRESPGKFDSRTLSRKTLSMKLSELLLLLLLLLRVWVSEGLTSRLLIIREGQI